MPTDVQTRARYVYITDDSKLLGSAAEDSQLPQKQNGII